LNPGVAEDEIRPGRDEHRARLQAEELDDVARFDGETANLLLADRVAEAGVHRVQDGRLRHDGDRLAKLADLELHVLTPRRVDAQLHPLEPRGLEAAQLDGEVIDAGRERRHLIQARFVADHRPRRRRRAVRRRDCGARHDVPLRVGHAA